MFQFIGFGGGNIKCNWLILLGLSLIFSVTISGSFAADNSQVTINGNVYTTAQIQDAINRVNTFQETNNRLPNYVTISGQKIPINDFLPYMEQTNNSINQGNGNTGGNAGTVANGVTINGVNYTNAQIQEAINRVNTFQTTYNRLPNYVTISGQKILINDFLPYMDGNSNTGNTGNSSGSGTQTETKLSFNYSQISTAASNVKTFQETNNRLPETVTISTTKVTMAQLLQLLTDSILLINTGSTDTITLKNVNAPSNQSESLNAGLLTKSEFLTLAQQINNTINSTGTAPASISTSLGIMNFQNLVYSFSKIMAFYETNKRLPNTLSVKSLNITTITTDGTVQSIIDAIGYAEAKFKDIQGQSDPYVMEKVGYGDCWADSYWLYNKLSAAGIAVRIMGCSNTSGLYYLHRWVEINIGNGWQTWNYAKYNSQHYGALGYGYFVVKSSV